MSDPSLTTPAKRARRWPSFHIGLPDIRLLGLLIYAGLTWKLLDMVARNPLLLNIASFMTVVTLIVGGGGLGLAATFMWGGTKSGSDVMKAQNDAVIASTPPPADGTTTTTTTTATEPRP